MRSLGVYLFECNKLASQLQPVLALQAPNKDITREARFDEALFWLWVPVIVVTMSLMVPLISNDGNIKDDGIIIIIHDGANIIFDGTIIIFNNTIIIYDGTIMVLLLCIFDGMYTYLNLSLVHRSKSSQSMLFW